MRKTIIGVMGPGGDATETDKKNAFEIGALSAQQGWVTLSGGRNSGVMEEVNKGAKSANGLTIGIIPTANNDHTSEAVDISIITSMGSARNNINVLSSDVVVVCGMGAGTASETAMALKANKNVVLLMNNDKATNFFSSLNKDLITICDSPAEVIERVKDIVSK